MKNLLVITYYFPPSGGPGVQRVLKHVKYLREFGWNPIVLTVENPSYQAIDESLLEQIPKETIVIKSRIFEPYDIYRKFTGKSKNQAIDVNNIKKEDQNYNIKEKIAEFIRATFFIPDARIAWLGSATKKAEEILNTYKIDAIYSSSPPYTCSLIAEKIKKKSKLPWVAGFRDPWTDFLTTPKRWLLPKLIDRRMEYKVFKNADLVECAWQGIIDDAMNKYPTLNKNKFLHVPNGFDSNDFPNVEDSINEKFTITYTGSLYGRRNPAALFQALENLIEEKKIKANDFKLVFVGRFGEEVVDMFNKASFSNSIDIVAYVPHKKSIEYLFKSDVLLLIVDESKDSKDIVPGKVYEYIGTKKPLLALAPEKSAIADLIKETKVGSVAHQSKVKEIKNIILDFYQSKIDNKSITEPITSEIEKYERRNASKELAKYLDNLTKNN